MIHAPKHESWEKDKVVDESRVSSLESNILCMSNNDDSTVKTCLSEDAKFSTHVRNMWYYKTYNAQDAYKKFEKYNYDAHNEDIQRWRNIINYRMGNRRDVFLKPDNRPTNAKFKSKIDQCYDDSDMITLLKKQSSVDEQERLLLYLNEDEVFVLGPPELSCLGKEEEYFYNLLKALKEQNRIIFLEKFITKSNALKLDITLLFKIIPKTHHARVLSSGLKFVPWLNNADAEKITQTFERSDVSVHNALIELINKKEILHEITDFNHYQRIFKVLNEVGKKFFLRDIKPGKTKIKIKSRDLVKAIMQATKWIFATKSNIIKKDFLKIICQSIKTVDDCRKLFVEINHYRNEQNSQNIISMQRYWIRSLCQGGKLVALLATADAITTNSLRMSIAPECRNFFDESFKQIMQEIWARFTNNYQKISALEKKDNNEKRDVDKEQYKKNDQFTM